jgi:hypothetical protein
MEFPNINYQLGSASIDILTVAVVAVSYLLTSLDLTVSQVRYHAGGLRDGFVAGFFFMGGKIFASNLKPSNFCGQAVPSTGTSLTATGPCNVVSSTFGVPSAAPSDDVYNAGRSSATGSLIVISASPVSN